VDSSKIVLMSMLYIMNIIMGCGSKVLQILGLETRWR